MDAHTQKLRQSVLVILVTVGLLNLGTVLRHDGARIRDVKIRGRRTNLNHTRPHTQSRWGEAIKTSVRWG